MRQKTDVQQGTLALMVLKTFEVLGPIHGYGIARRMEPISRARYYQLTRQGRRHLQTEVQDWRQTTEIMARWAQS